MKTNNYKKYVDILIKQYGIEYIKKLCANFIEEHTIILHEVNNTLEPLDDGLSAVIDTIARGEYERAIIMATSVDIMKVMQTTKVTKITICLHERASK